jgi:uncharacterized protein (DUF488 family)
MPLAPIFTLGHSNLEIDAFLDLLQRHAIQLVVDIRSVPYSRFHPQFNRAALSQAIEAAGIGYRFAGQHLGGRPTDPACYRNGVVPSGKDEIHRQLDYRLVMARPWYQTAICELMEWAQAQRLVILCAEEDPAHCHRQRLVTQSLLALAVEVRHIRRTGEIQMGWVEQGELF